MNSNDEKKEMRIGSNFMLYTDKVLGKGAFGELHLGMNLKDDTEIAIKKEDATKANSQLSIETKILILLKGGDGIPNVFYYMEGDRYNYMVMDLLGKSLEDLFHQHKRVFSHKSILMLGMQMLSRVQYIHSKGIIHRDIKPDNYLMGAGKNSHLVYLIDYGLAKRYKDPKTGIHIKYKDGKSLTGTARYASVFTLMGVEQSRRDDLESIAYSLIYLFRGDLPWQGIKAKTKKEKYSKILDMKKYMRLEELCSGIHRNIINFLVYCRELNFEERPDYEYLYSLLEEIFEQYEFEYDFQYDWVLGNNSNKNPRSISKEKDCKKREEKENNKDNKLNNSNNKNVNLKALNDANNKMQAENKSRSNNNQNNNSYINSSMWNNQDKQECQKNKNIDLSDFDINIKGSIVSNKIQEVKSINYEINKNNFSNTNNNKSNLINADTIIHNNFNNDLDDVDSDKDTEEYVPQNLDYDIQILD